jgi:hypothetical protein
MKYFFHKSSRRQKGSEDPVAATSVGRQAQAILSRNSESSPSPQLRVATEDQRRKWILAWSVFATELNGSPSYDIEAKTFLFLDKCVQDHHGLRVIQHCFAVVKLD